MTSDDSIRSSEQQDPLELADRIANLLAETAVARDAQGGTPKRERDALLHYKLRDMGLGH